MRRTVMSLAVLAVSAALAVVAAAAALAASGAAGKPTVTVTGTTVKDGVVTVAVRITGWKLLPALVGTSPNTPGGGHWHIFVDGKYNAAAAATRGATRSLAPGTHTISVELANNDHSRLTPPAHSAAVKVIVAAAAAAAGGAAPPAAGDNGTNMGDPMGNPAGY